MIDHLTFGVSDYPRSTSFYDRVLQPLGAKRLFEISCGPARRAGYGDGFPRFWIAENDPTHGALHIAFTAKNREAVDALHREALAVGGVDDGAPGHRPHYYPSYYGAFVRDPDGHNIEAVFHDQSKT